MKFLGKLKEKKQKTPKHGDSGFTQGRIRKVFKNLSVGSESHSSQVRLKNVQAQFLKESRKGYSLHLSLSVVFVLSSVLVLWLGAWNYLLPHAQNVSAIVIEGEAAATNLSSLKLKAEAIKNRVDQSVKKLKSTSNKLASSAFSRMRVSDFIGTLESNSGNVKTFCIGVLKPGMQPCDVEELSANPPSKSANTPASAAKESSVYDELLKNKSLAGSYVTVAGFALEAARIKQGKNEAPIGVEGVTLAFEVDPQFYFSARQTLMSELPQLLILKESIELNVGSGLAKISLELAYPFASI